MGMRYIKITHDSSLIMNMQIKTKQRIQFTTIKEAYIKKHENVQYWQDCSEK